MAGYYSQMKDALKRGHQFVTHGVWQIGRPGEDVPQGFVIKQVRVAILLGSKLLDGMHMVRASSLAFATVLSIVPFLAVTFYIIETFNLGEDLYALVQDRLETAAERVSALSLEESDAAETDTGEADAELAEDAEVDASEVEAPAGFEEVAAETEVAAAADARAPPEGEEGVVVEEGEEIIGEDGEVLVASEDLTKSQELQRKIIGSIFQGVTEERDGMKDPVAEITDMVASLAHDAATNTTALTVSGILLVFTTVFGLMRNIENTFNRIWGVRRNRSWYRMFSDYIVITLLLPFVAAVVLGVTAALQSEQILSALGPLAYGLRFSQHIMLVLVFTMLYKLVPSTHVHFRYALLAGVIAGTAWVLLSLGFIRFQFGLARYAVMLSAFAQFPMLLGWIYLSWAILLLGCEIAYAYQNESTFAMERYAEGASYAYKEAVGMRAMIEIGVRFEEGRPPLSLEEMASEWNVPQRLLRETLESLIEAGYLSACATDPIAYQPARPLETIKSGDIIGALREVGEDPSLFRQDESFKPIFDELARHDDEFGGATLAELVEGFRSSSTSEVSSEPLNA